MTAPPRREIPRLADDYTAVAARRRLAFLTAHERFGRNRP
jgi:hypothetical protein